MTYGFIITAGKQTRFNYPIPKALASYNGKPILVHNIELMNKYCDDIYVVCSENNFKYFNSFKNLNLIILKDNLGCGDAVAKALDYAKPGTHDAKCIIQWGDIIQTKDVYDSLDFNDNSWKIQVPCYEEKNPYVNLEMDVSWNIKKVLFSKFNEIENNIIGYHDCSLFYGNYYNIYNNCLDYMTIFRKKDGYKDIGHGNEFNFLDIFNQVCLSGYGKLVNGEIPKSFNTLEELYLIGGYV